MGEVPFPLNDYIKLARDAGEKEMLMAQYQSVFFTP
jgi:hypothetical protein